VRQSIEAGIKDADEEQVESADDVLVPLDFQIDRSLDIEGNTRFACDSRRSNRRRPRRLCGIPHFSGESDVELFEARFG
jgi:hypothetical protein